MTKISRLLTSNVYKLSVIFMLSFILSSGCKTNTDNLEISIPPDLKWDDSMLKITPEPPVMPKYIFDVNPRVSSVESFAESGAFGLILVRGITVSFSLATLGEPEASEWDAIKDKVFLEINGHTIMNDTLIGGIHPYNEPGGDTLFIASWLPVLEAGQYNAKFILLWDGFEHTYSWDFLISPYETPPYTR